METARSRYLIINSDDYGYSVSINKGIANAFEQNIITNTSLLANGECFDDAITRARDGSYTDKIGLHANITEGKPLGGPYNTLTDERGNFLGIRTLILKEFNKQIDEEEVREEISLQIKQCRENGIELSHIDTHQWSQVIPCIADAIEEASTEYGIRFIRNINETYILKNFLGASLKGVTNSIGLSVLNTIFNNKRDRPRMVMPDFYHGVLLMGHTDLIHALMRVIENLPYGTSELMCHISSDTYDDLANRTSYARARYKEFEALSSKEFKETVSRNNVQLVSYRDIEAEFKE